MRPARSLENFGAATPTEDDPYFLSMSAISGSPMNNPHGNQQSLVDVLNAGPPDSSGPPPVMRSPFADDGSPPMTGSTSTEKGKVSKQERAQDMFALDRLIAALDEKAEEEKERRRTVYSDAASGKTTMADGGEDSFPLPNAGLFRAALGSIKEP
jgi:hypothetical protein